MTAVGLFGLLGTGNLGNDGSLAAVLGYLRAEHPSATLHAFCGGPEEVTERYDVPATRLNWNRAEYRTASGPRLVAGKAFGKLVDAFRTAAWVRRQDVVIVPGMGVLETTLPTRPWGWPYSLLLMCLSGKLFRTKVVLLSVGAERIESRAIRTMILRAARLATYRSYRDELSRDAMRAMGLDTARDKVYPDLVFGVPAPEPVAGTGIVGVGVMAYRGNNSDRERGEEIYRAYVTAMTRFVRRLVDGGRTVRLFTGDQVDESVAAEIIAAVGPSVSMVEVSTLDELMAEMAAVDTVVATRYHNVLCALKLSKPTISIGYAAKNDVMMADFGLGEFCQSARAVDVEALVERFTALEDRAAELRATLAERNRRVARRVEQQFAELSALLRPAGAEEPQGVG
ncbi:MAG: hypothetical protein GEV28_05270 [Actinophytocola sp.]|uniref:polysaccharide pyruvyl transferase family protein n=1 Tax=Actinophytocola sp. TaxID=1872138 RepID=UPI00132B2FDD|nr:polysaccharide pyruvyl transferase family protein [Actinophytocola sp.]MPZ79827.1 hypothetical protein [Actinophytocola sp.]